MFQKNTTLITETEAADEAGAEIAIVGMAGRFPGADDVGKFWQNLRDGVDAITDFSDEELLAAGVDPQTLQDPNYVKAGAVLSDIEGFDAAFFGLTPREAQVLDPQHRLFLEAAWNAIESAGYDTATYRGAIGLFAGAAMSDYVLNNLFPNQELQETLGRGFTVLSNDKDALATRAAYLLDLTGPCCSVQTYCSTSLVAVGLACDSLVNGESDMALAGGVALNVPQRVGYLYQDGGITSPDGRCRAFDAKAQGSPLGSGVAVVVLKRLQDALDDGDTIYAVIKGWAVNNDGAMRTGFTAPGVRGQAKVVLEALSHAEVEAESINYIEAHGTGTALGDAVEFAALLKSFGEHTDKKGFCAVGSVKTNVGHLDRAAGATGLIKTALALKHQLIPPTLHYHEPNPEIDFSRTPFYVNTALRPWLRNGQPRRAGVSSFGMGGTNAHVILEEAPQVPVDAPARPYQLMLLSARSQAALATAVTNLRAYLLENPDVNLADVAYTLQVGRKPFEYRRAFVCQGREDALRIVESGDPARSWERAQVAQERPFAFMFPGVGDHYPHMAQELYEVEPVFRQVVDDCCQQLQPILGLDLRELLFPAITVPAADGELNLRQMLGRQKSSDDRLNRTEFAQPGVFVIEYALAQLLRSWGVEPGALIGYSLGEYVAACVAGVLPLEAALRLVARRAQLIQQLPGGSMLAVPLSEAAVRPYVQDPVCLAIVNGPQNCVLAGPPEAIHAVEQQLTAQDIACRRLETSHAFHSTMMTPIVAEFTALVRSVPLSPPQLPYVSNVTGDWITAAQATDPAYWAQHLCQTVRFGDGLARLLAEPHQLLLEVGPGQSLSSFAKQHPACTREQVVQILPTLPYVYNRRSDVAFLLSTLAKVWLHGHPLDWDAFYGDERRQRLPLPTYPFERQRYWIDPPATATAAAKPVVATGKKANSADWFYEPVWQAGPLSIPHRTINGRCLIFEDVSGWGTAVGTHLSQGGVELIRVQAGQAFSQADANLFTLRPDAPADYQALVAALQTSGELPAHIIHAWGIDTADAALPAREMFQAEQQKGFYSLLYLAQALSRQAMSTTFQVMVLTGNMQAVDGNPLCPEKATVLGLCRVISQEYQNIRCRSVDVSPTAVGDAIPAATIAQLLAELSNPATEVAIAYRQDTRYVQQFVPKRPQPVVERIRQQGVYLITGGLGGIGLTLADYLARHYQATLILLGRSGLPAPETWDAWLAEHGADDSTSRRIQQVRALQANGAEVLVLAADVADEEQMRVVVDEIEARYGRLHGVIHAAGYVARAAFPPIQETDPAICEAHFQSKVYGLYVLDKVLQGKELDFCCLFSSLSSVLGGLGVAAYAAANNFMDAYTAQRHQTGAAHWVTVNWDTWLFNEMEMASLVGATVAEFAMSPAEGTEAFALALASGAMRLVHSTGDLHGRIRQWVMLETLTAVSRPAQNAARPALTSGYVAAGKGMEKQIAQVWEA
ncbi:MAG: SDR family oxidoreductase, partial [Anaerolineae bacterium]|nr:SDR family oxidoreductase [Anaerolineae bacterium]